MQFVVPETKGLNAETVFEHGVVSPLLEDFEVANSSFSNVDEFSRCLAHICVYCFSHNPFLGGNLSFVLCGLVVMCFVLFLCRNNKSRNP